MSNVLSTEKIRIARDTIDTFLDSLSCADNRKQKKALSKYIEFLLDVQVKLMAGEILEEEE